MKKTMEMLDLTSYTLMDGIGALVIGVGSYTITRYITKAMFGTIIRKFKAIRDARKKKIKDKKQDQTEKEKIEVEVIQ